MVVWALSKYACLPAYGAATRLFNLARNFQENGHETLLLTSDANHLADFPKSKKIYNHENINGLKVCWIKTKKYSRTASISRLLSWLDFECKLFCLPRKSFHKPDIIIVSSLSLLSIIYGYFLKKRYNSTLVFEIRDIWPLTMTEEGGFSSWHPLVLLLGMVEKFGYKKADLIVGTMPRLDLHVREILGHDRPFFCSPIGYSKESKSASLSNLGKLDLESYFPKDKIIVGYCGSMGISNALDTLIRCIEMLDEHPDVHFVLVGDGDLRKKYMLRLALSANATFVPRVPPTEVPHFLALCDILYLSTHNSKVWRFGQSMNKFVEYMLSSKPILATYSGFPSMLNESKAGEFVQPDDEDLLKAAILKYTSMTSSEREGIGANGRRWILRNRSYERLADDYLLEMEKLFSHRT
jgi:glycosyltransferase involved in cell wall biosynthesis